MPPIAHAGHWLVNILYLVPLAIVVGMLAVSAIRDRRAAAAEAAAGPGPPDGAADEQAAP